MLVWQCKCKSTKNVRNGKGIFFEISKKMLGIEKKCVTLRKMKECPMVSISTYEDLISINSELAKLFLCPENATDLIACICGGVKDWVNKHNKQYWSYNRICQWCF